MFALYQAYFFGENDGYCDGRFLSMQRTASEQSAHTIKSLRLVVTVPIARTSFRAYTTTGSYTSKSSFNSAFHRDCRLSH